MEETKTDILKRFNRLLVWPTLVLFILLAISGYGITNNRLISELTGGLFTHPLSLYLHTILVLPTLILLMIHILIAIRSTLTRWGIKEDKTLLALMQYVVS